MMLKILAIFQFYFVLVQSESIRVLDFFGNGLKDNADIHYATLKTDSDVRFSTQMTICVSIYMRSFVMEQSLFQVLDVDDKPWFSLYFLQLDENSMTHPLSLAVDGVYSHLHQVDARPLRWNHACIGAKDG